jgi:ABC-type transport system substrate-binding protein
MRKIARTSPLLNRRQLLSASGASWLARSDTNRSSLTSGASSYFVPNPEIRSRSQDSTLRVAFFDAPISFDPLLAQSRFDHTVVANVFEGLVRRTFNGEIVPLLAESWESRDDDQLYSFLLRPALFHNGEALNAEVAALNFEWILTQKESFYGGLLSRIVSNVIALDESILEIALQRPFGGLLDLLAYPDASITSRSAVENNRSDATEVFGTGPFYLEGSNSEAPAVLAPFEEYWGGVQSSSGAIELTIAEPDIDVVAFALEERTIDAVKVRGPELPSLVGTPSLTLATQLSFRLYHWAFNFTNDLFSDYRIRKAFNLAIDRNFIVANVLNGQGVPADCPIAPNLPGYVPLDLYPYDPVQAQQLLAEAGFPPDWTGRVLVSSEASAFGSAVAEEIRRMLGEVGVGIELVDLPSQEYFEYIRAPQNSDQVASRDFAEFVFGTGIPEETLRLSLASDSFPPSGVNIAFFNDPAIDARIRAAMDAPRNQRGAHLEMLSRDVFDLAPWLFSHFEMEALVHTTDISGIDVSPRGAVIFNSVQWT